MPGGDLTSPPQPDELEISVFGPGYGECVVVHAANHQWIVIDSCRSATGRAAAIEYLEVLRVDVSTQVRLVVATHYHDDHIAGIGELHEACNSAHFGCSMALNSAEWGSLVSIYRNYHHAAGSGIDEFRRVMTTLQKRAEAGKIVAPIFCLTHRGIRDPVLLGPAELTCLAPSDAAVAIMQARMREEVLPKSQRRRLRVPSLKQNDSSVVLSVRVGAASALLGADLEERGRAGLGWQAILDALPTDYQPHDGFKIPHHGSSTGYHPDVWGRLVSRDGWAVVTPYNRQKVPLPTGSDCTRILKMIGTDNAFITSAPGWAKFRHPDPAVQKTSQEATLAIAPEQPKDGHVRLRRSIAPSALWVVELFGEAHPLSSIQRAA